VLEVGTDMKTPRMGRQVLGIPWKIVVAEEGLEPPTRGL
jgi:hypothetical protein